MGNQPNGLSAFLRSFKHANMICVQASTLHNRGKQKIDRQKFHYEKDYEFTRPSSVIKSASNAGGKLNGQSKNKESK